jgi:transcriptional regulator with XRE-family HTH domain
MYPQRLKKWRERNNFSVEELASVLGVRPEVVAQWESGRRREPYSLGLVLEEIEKRGRQWAFRKFKNKVGFLNELVSEGDNRSRRQRKLFHS